MFTAALLTIAKIQKQQKCPLTEGCRKRIPLCIHTHTHTHTHTMEYYSAIKKNETMPLASTWMDLEIVILNEVSQIEKKKYCMTSLLCGI